MHKIKKMMAASCSILHRMVWIIIIIIITKSV